MSLTTPGDFENFKNTSDANKATSNQIKSLSDPPPTNKFSFRVARSYKFSKKVGDYFVLVSNPNDGSWASIERNAKKNAVGKCRFIKDGQTGKLLMLIVSIDSGKIKMKEAVTIAGLTVVRNTKNLQSATSDSASGEMMGKSREAAGLDEIPKNTRDIFSKVILEIDEYSKFSKKFSKFLSDWNITNDKKLPVTIWNSIINGLIGKTDLSDLIAKDPKTDRFILGTKVTIQGKKINIRNAVLQQAMDGLDKFVEHAKRHMDKVVATTSKGDRWCFWSGIGAKEMAIARGGIALESTTGAWFDGQNCPVFSKLTGVTNFQLWTALSEAYAAKAAEYYQDFKLEGYLGPGATLTSQTVFQQIEQPTFEVEVLGTKKDAQLPPIDWYVVKCDKNETTGKWVLDKGTAPEKFTTRKSALAAVNERYDT